MASHSGPAILESCDRLSPGDLARHAPSGHIHLRALDRSLEIPTLCCARAGAGARVQRALTSAMAALHTTRLESRTGRRTSLAPSGPALAALADFQPPRSRRHQLAVCQ